MTQDKQATADLIGIWCRDVKCVQILPKNWYARQLPRSAVLPTDGCSEGRVAIDLLSSAKDWESFDIVSPTTGKVITYALAHLGYVPLGDGARARLFAVVLFSS
jgi:hypothetical protein